MLLRLPRRWRPPRQSLLVPGLLATLGVLGAVVALWAARSVPLREVGDGGLAASIPAAYWAGVAAVNLGLALSLVRRSPTWLSCLLLASLVVVVYGAGIVVSEVPRGAVSWRHLGIADALAGGRLDPRIDAYFNWPGFFAGLATFIAATGLAPEQVAMWSPLVNVALWAVAVAAIVRVFTRDRAVLVVALWLFLVGNWIDQDYLSPQAFGFLLHLTVLALLLHVLGAREHHGDAAHASRARIRLRGPLAPASSDGRTRTVAMLLVLLLGATLVASHQLSPVMLAVSAGALTLLRRTWAPWFPVILGLMLVAWLTYPASTYLAGHPLFGEPAQSGIVGTNLLDRLAGSPGRLLVQFTRMGLSVSLWLLAAVGAVRLWIRGRRDPRPVVLGVVPFLLLPTVSYGGEMLLRVTLFALPFVAYLAAWGLAPLLRTTVAAASRAARVRAALVLALVVTALTVASVTARYGNVQFDTFTADEVAAVERLGEVAPPGTTIVAGAPSTPWASEGYADYTRRSVESLCERDRRPRPCVEELRLLAASDESGYGLTLLLTRGNQASLKIQSQLSGTDFARFEARLRRLPGTELLYENRDARLYHLTP